MANINKNIIMQAGAAVANATNKAAGLSASTPEPGTIISVIQLVNGGRKIGPADVVHFTESVRNKLLSMLVSMEPIQDFNGYGHPWPGGGGKNLIEPWPNAVTISGITVEFTENGEVWVHGTPTIQSGYISFPFNYFPNSVIGETITISVNEKTLGIGFNVGSSNGSLNIPMSSTLTSRTGTYTATGETAGRFAINVNYDVGTIDKIYKVQFEIGSSATEWTPYSNICPITGRTGANAYVSPTPNVADATAYSADWTTPAGTVYAGSADIVTGDIKAAPYYASYNGETLVGPWVSSMDEYDPEETPTTGSQVVDLGGTMTVYHITGQDIITLVGDNYIWSDSGDVTITE